MSQLSTRTSTPLELAKEGKRLLNWTEAGAEPFPNEWDGFCALFDDGTLIISDAMKGTNEAGAVIRMSRSLRNVETIDFCPASHMQELVNFLSRSRGSNDNTDTDGQAEKALKTLIEEADKLNASDIHLAIRGNIMTIQFRVFGLLTPGETYDFAFGSSIQRTAYEVGDQREKTYIENEPQAGRIKIDDLRINVQYETVRTNWTNNAAGRELVMRCQPPLSKFISLEKMNYSAPILQAFKYMMENSKGTYVACGPTGSGKTTLLAMLAATQFHLLKGEKKFKGFADPIEYEMPFDQVSINEGYDLVARGLKFQIAFYAELRNDIDYAFYGEMRDFASIMAVISFVDSGHFAWASSHASTPIRLIPKLKDQGVTTNSIYDPNVLSGAIGQRLIPVLCECAKPAAKSQDHKECFTRLKELNIPLEGIRARNHTGCRKCRSGIVGMQPVAEILMYNQDIMDMYRKDNIRGIHDYLITNKTPSFSDDALSRLLDGTFDPAMLEQNFGHFSKKLYREQDW